MSTYGYSRKRSKGVGAKKVALGLLLASVVVFGAVGGNAYLKSKELAETKAHITELEAQKQELNSKIHDLQEEGKTLEAEVKKIEEILWRFEPIIIPDSMK